LIDPIEKILIQSLPIVNLWSYPLIAGAKNVRIKNKEPLAFSGKIGCGSALFMLFLS
jgi:hypothetical protein